MVEHHSRQQRERAATWCIGTGLPLVFLALFAAIAAAAQGNSGNALTALVGLVGVVLAGAGFLIRYGRQ